MQHDLKTHPMDLKLQDITLPSFLWYWLPGLFFVVVTVGIPVALYNPALLSKIDSIGGIALLSLLALVAGFTMDSIRLYSFFKGHAREKDKFFLDLSQIFECSADEIRDVIDILRLDASENGVVGRSVASNHARWVMMMHSAVCFLILAGILVFLAIWSKINTITPWYHEKLNTAGVWGIIFDALLVSMFIYLGQRVVDHSLKEKKINNKEYLRYAMINRQRLCVDLSLQCVRASAELDAKNLLNIHEIIVRLKSIKRQGWIEHQLEDVESVADHTFMVCILAYILAPHAGCDRSKSVILSLLHDLPESIVGDITPNDSRLQQKRMMEAAAMKEIASLIDDSSIYELWREVELGTTPEGKLVKDLDRLEVAMQSMIYEAKLYDVDLSEFRFRANAKLNTPFVQRLLEEIVCMWQSQELG